ncbi:hypothetical protein VNO77_16513 [Canavalia gladiata]|uniref:Uncharacterized protein n=1 Tax=Canavalia gladiata TaxID=3824 RepID=A0AAN9M5M8_CANGL
MGAMEVWRAKIPVSDGTLKGKLPSMHHSSLFTHHYYLLLRSSQLGYNSYLLVYHGDLRLYASMREDLRSKLRVGWANGHVFLNRDP